MGLFREAIDKILDYTDCDSMTPEEFNASVPFMTAVCDTIDASGKVTIPVTKLKEVIANVHSWQDGSWDDYAKGFRSGVEVVEMHLFPNDPKWKEDSWR